MNPIDAVAHCLTNWRNFKGRASRSEFWWFFLFLLPVAFTTDVLGKVSDAAVGAVPSWLMFVVFLITTYLQICFFAVAARRLHDTNRSGWWQLISFTVIGIPILIFFYCQRGDESSNSFG